MAPFSPRMFGFWVQSKNKSKPLCASNRVASPLEQLSSQSWLTSSSSFLCSWIGISLVIVLFLVINKPNRFLLDLNPIYFRLCLPNVNDNAYTRNKQVVDIEIINSDRVLCPKSIDVDRDGKLYTGTVDGKVVCLEASNFEQSTIADFPNGGRPLGVRISSQNVLYFIEGNTGLYSFDLVTKHMKLLLDVNRTKFIDGKASKFFDDLVVVEEDGKTYIYITDVSRKFDLTMWCYTYLEPDFTGRILRYDVDNDTVGVILENLSFPNGIEVTKAQDALLICELTKRRILKHYIKGPKACSTQVFIDNLPGEPENIRRSLCTTRDTFWIGLALTRDYRAETSFLDEYATEPNLRKLILRTCFILGSVMLYVGNLCNYDVLKQKGTQLKTGLALILDDFMTLPGMAVEVDAHSGDVVTSVSIRNNVSVISEIREVTSLDSSSRLLYVGSSGGKLGKIVLNVQ